MSMGEKSLMRFSKAVKILEYKTADQNLVKGFKSSHLQNIPPAAGSFKLSQNFLVHALKGRHPSNTKVTQDRAGLGVGPNMDTG